MTKLLKQTLDYVGFLLLFLFGGINMHELFFHKTVSRNQKPSPEKGPRKISLGIRCKVQKYNTAYDTSNEVDRFLTDNWKEHRKFPTI